MQGENDFATYRQMCEPFENPEQAGEALESFFAEIRAIRKKYRIMDVHVIAKVNILRGESEGSAMSSAHFGNTLEGAPMCAWGLGREQSEYEAVLQKYTKAG